MKPVEIQPEDEWEGSALIHYGPPPGMGESVTGVFALMDSIRVIQDGVEVPAPRISIKIELTHDDLQQLKKRPYFWLSFLTTKLVPFQIAVQPEGTEHPTGGDNGN